MNKMTDEELKQVEKQIGGFLEKPYSNTKPISKYWVKVFDKTPGYFLIDFELNFFCHSENWAMGSLNIDVFSLAIALGPYDFFWAYRIEITPPKPNLVGDIHN